MHFKYIVAIVRPEVLAELEAKFGGLHVRGITATKVKGFGEYIDLLARNHLTEHIKVEAFVEESKADAVVDAILDVAHSNVPGAGIVAVMPVENFLHIRTRSETLPDTPKLAADDRRIQLSLIHINCL